MGYSDLTNAPDQQQYTSSTSTNEGGGAVWVVGSGEYPLGRYVTPEQPDTRTLTERIAAPFWALVRWIMRWEAR